MLMEELKSEFYEVINWRRQNPWRTSYTVAQLFNFLAWIIRHSITQLIIMTTRQIRILKIMWELYGKNFFIRGIYWNIMASKSCRNQKKTDDKERTSYTTAGYQLLRLMVRALFYQAACDYIVMNLFQFCHFDR